MPTAVITSGAAAGAATAAMLASNNRKQECQQEMEFCDPIKKCDENNICEYTGQWDCSEYDIRKEKKIYR